MNYQAVETVCSLILETTMPLLALPMAFRLFPSSEMLFLSPARLYPSILQRVRLTSFLRFPLTPANASSVNIIFKNY